MIYLDYNATAPIRPEVIALTGEMMALPSNPSSVHGYGRAAKAHIERARRTIAEALSCFPAELLFTASGTEANVTVLRACGHMPMAVAATEHASVLKTASHAVHLPVARDGVLKMDALEIFLRECNAPALISVMLANNETGVIQPIMEIARTVHAYGGLLHCDAVQALGKIPVDTTLLGVDFLSVSAHKIGGAQGIGALMVNQKVPLPPLITGGGQELGRRAGTENVAGIVGFARAVELAVHDTAWQKQLRSWLDGMEASCQRLAGDEDIVIGKTAQRLPNTSCLRLPRMASETQLMQYDLKGIALSAGSACSSGRIASSHVVRAMWGEDATDDMVRISGGWHTTQAEIHAFTTQWKRLMARV
jgi:cysteine desulfurase